MKRRYKVVSENPRKYVVFRKVAFFWKKIGETHGNPGEPAPSKIIHADCPYPEPEMRVRFVYGRETPFI